MLTIPAPTRLFKKAGFPSPCLKATLFSHLARGWGGWPAAGVTQPAHAAAASQPQLYLTSR